MTFLAVMFYTTFLHAQTKTQTERHFYSPTLPKVELSEAKTQLARILKETESWDSKNSPSSIPKDVSVTDDEFKITYKKHNNTSTWHYSKLLQCPIEIIQIKDLPPRWNGYTIRLGSLRFTTEKITDNFKQLADYLFFFQQHFHIYTIQQQQKERYDSLLTIFKPIAAQYVTLKVKPPVSEEQRKFIVQANSLNEKKMFDGAIELYNKAIEIDQTSYPSAYSNLALLSAKLEKFDEAIFYMHKYILLEPGTSDARSAQDKIYEWELSAGK